MKKLKDTLYALILLATLALLVFACMRLLKPIEHVPGTITIRISTYDSMKRGLLNQEQIDEEINNIDVSDKHFRDSILTRDEVRHPRN